MTKTAHISRPFNKDELGQVEKAVTITEDLVNSFYKMSSGQWLKNRYDIKTFKDLESHEQIHGPVAQVIKYRVHPVSTPLGSLSFSLYKVCLQDMAILSTVDRVGDLVLPSFLLYVLTHELVHVVRFSKYEQRYENKSEADVTLAEERKVHALTHQILHSVSSPGLSKVFEFYKDWLV